MQDNKVYLAVLSASLFGVSIPVIAESEPPLPANVRQVSDSRLAMQVKASLLTDSLVSGLDIHVVSDQGVIYLSGTVSEAEQKRATELAHAVPGVREVRSRLDIIRTGEALRH